MPRPAPPQGHVRHAANGYMIVREPSHPRASPSGYVYAHVLIAERALGRRLSSAHPVHHFNEAIEDNANANLVICEDKAYHLLLHVRMRVARLGGDPNYHKICDSCGLQPLTAFGMRRRYPDGLDRICKPCKAAQDRAYYVAKTQESRDGQ